MIKKTKLPNLSEIYKAMEHDDLYVLIEHNLFPLHIISIQYVKGQESIEYDFFLHIIKIIMTRRW